MEEVWRPSDGELCGHVEERAGLWYAMTVFGASFGCHDSRQGAVDQVLAEGLLSLAERWTLRPRDGDEEVVVIQEANAAAVTVARGYYSMPGVPTLTITAVQIASGEWELRR